MPLQQVPQVWFAVWQAQRPVAQRRLVIVWVTAAQSLLVNRLVKYLTMAPAALMICLPVRLLPLYPGLYKGLFPARTTPAQEFPATVYQAARQKEAVLRSTAA